MPSLSAVARRHTDLEIEDIAWLQLIQADWQVIADLCFADLVLWLPDRHDLGFWAGDQMRPTTGPTVYIEDSVGSGGPAGERPLVDVAYKEGTGARE
ncbi:MAG: histidine kinase N-terminal domain-containing protein, partial [Nocardioidaceae bacterium]|nr:histidine kinase N-terminal domain-containing protein [Nocardioidaceae bacterium]